MIPAFSKIETPVTISGERESEARVKLAAKVVCDSGGCPTIFAAGDDVIVQGYVVNPVDMGVDLRAGELLVRIPRDLLHVGVAHLRCTLWNETADRKHGQAY
jgi:hypothetical protein